MTRPKCLDLFAGGGGASLGLHRAGYDVLGVEWDAGAARVHRALGMPCLCADVSDPATWLDEVLAWLDGEPLALLWASPPCQDWSSAGKRAGATGERNGWPWTWAAVDALRAAGVRVDAFAAENVRGLLHHSRRECGDPMRCPGCYWAASIVPECAARFPASDSRVLNAVDYGVPQHRRRVILWGGPGGIRWPAPTHAEPGTLFGSEWQTACGMSEPSATVTATEGRGCPSDTRRAARSAGRRLALEECAALQGWPEVVAALGECATVEARYRVVGNAVPPELARVVGVAAMAAWVKHYEGGER